MFSNKVRREFLRLIVLGSAMAVMIGLSACEVAKRTTNKVPVVPNEQQDFGYGSDLQADANNQIFFTNKFFLWRDLPNNASKEEIDREAAVRAAVISAGDRVDMLDDQGKVLTDALQKLDLKLDQLSDTTFPEKTKLLTPDLKAAFESYISLMRENAKTYTQEEFKKNISKYRNDLSSAGTQMEQAAVGSNGGLREALKRLTELALQKSDFMEPSDDAKRQELQAEIDKVLASLPADLPGAVKDAKSRFDEAASKLEGTYYDRLRGLELPGLIDAEATKLVTLTGEAKELRDQFDALVGERDTQYREYNRVGNESYDLTNVVMASTEYYESMPSRVAFNFTSGGVKIAVRSFPVKDDNLEYTTENNGIRNVSFQAKGAVLRFEIWTGDYEYFKVRISENRLDRRTSKWHSYQGSMDRYRFENGEWKMRRGQAKLATGN